MRVLVTGGLGAVGTPLVRELRARGNEVWVCDLPHSEGPNYLRCDVGIFRQLQRLFETHDFDFVYHQAAEFGRYNGEDFYETMWRSNAVGTKNLLTLQAQHRFRMVFTSSSEVYGDYRQIMNEEVMDTVAVKQMNDYAMTKWVNEMQILNSASRFGTETVRVRLFNTYGPGEYYSQYRSAICVFIYRVLHNLPYTVYTKHKRTSSYVDDTVGTLANIYQKFKPGMVYNIAGSELHDMKECSDIILHYLGKSDSLVRYKDEQPDTTMFKRVDVSRAIHDLGHKSTVSLEEGIPRTIEWQRGVYLSD